MPLIVLNMSYQVLARRWRPKTFAELVGQAHVVRALTHALQNDRLHHAYLFTGTRGVGKTTIARILAKSLNCETGVTAEPCGQCGICQEVDGGRFVDLIEVDAASKTGVDDTRELLENVPYAPVRGRYKVYLIDEVHMFSSNSFNALLKTLEEPPPHVKFLFATTDPQKVPVTVLSRCLQFSLKRLPVDQIQTQFSHILAAEQIQAEPEALQLLARAAEGSMRDGLSLLDQAIAFSGGELDQSAVRDMLGVTSSDTLPALLRHIHQGEAAEAMQKVCQLAELAPDFASLLKDILLLLHRVSLIQAMPNSWRPDWGDEQSVRQLAEMLSPEDSQLYYQIALTGQRDLPLAPDAQSGFEMILLRMLAFRPDKLISNAASNQPTAKEQAKPIQPTRNRHSASTPVAAAPQPVAPTAHPSTAGFTDWHQVLPQLGLKGMTAQLASHCTISGWDGESLTLAVAQQAASLIGVNSQQRLQQALERYHGRAVKLQLKAAVSESQDTPAIREARAKAERQQQAEENIAKDPFVQVVQDRFDGVIESESVRPLVNEIKDK